jgi:hypothetical protein
MNMVIDSLIKFMAPSQIPECGFSVKVHEMNLELLAQILSIFTFLVLYYLFLINLIIFQLFLIISTQIYKHI